MLLCDSSLLGSSGELESSGEPSPGVCTTGVSTPTGEKINSLLLLLPSVVNIMKEVTAIIRFEKMESVERDHIHMVS